VKAPLIAWRHELVNDERLKQREQHIALVLSVYWDGDGRKAHPSVARLVRQTGMSERTVRYTLAGIRDLGIVEAVVKPGRTTIYHAVIPYPTPATRAGGSVCTALSGIAGGLQLQQGDPCNQSRTK
jgi:DNA-binding transcriptional ArsR family regulator